MKKMVFAFSFLLWGQISCAASPPLPKASDILLDVERRGAHPVVRELCGDWDRWKQLLKAISSGEKEWLSVAAKLQPGTDASCSETLSTSIFFALGSAPLDSLRLLADKTFSVEFVCSSNFLIDTPADKNALEIIDKRITSVRSVKDQKLIPVRDSCVKNLQQARTDTLKVMKEASVKKP